MSNRYIGAVVTETVNVAQPPYSGAWTLQAEMQGTAQGNWARTPLAIANSLRFRSSATAYLSRTFSTASTNRLKGSLSFWVKRGTLGAQVDICSFYDGSSSASSDIYFNTSNQLEFDFGFGAGYSLITNAVFRDPSAWYHIVISVDTTQAVASNRVTMYVNGVQQSLATANYPAQNTNWQIASVNANNRFGANWNSTGAFLDAYLANIDFIDGQALGPSYFGQFNLDTGVWGPAPYVGTYGTNGFKLNFSNGTSTTTLGYDSSGNGNNWTTNNISLTAGSTYDWMIDSPSNFAGSSYGVGNYCVMNPLAVDASYATASITSGNLSAVNSSASAALAFASMSAGSGKWYWEWTITGIPSTGILFMGVAPSPYTATNLRAYRHDNGQYFNGTAWVSYGAAYTTNDVIGVALDMDAQTLTFYKNGVSQGQNSSIGLSGVTVFPFMYANYSSGGIAANFGQRPFAYTPPTGFKSLCTYNLPAASITNGAQYMAATAYTGTNGTLSVSNSVNNVGFKPDLVWVKNRSSGYEHELQDSVRGTYRYISSDSTDAENTNANNDWFKSFDTNGFTAAYTSSGSVSTSNWTAAGSNFIAWQWKAGGTAVTNTAGSITSQVSANTTAGFSVVTYTGTGANATVGHGIGTAPSFIIIKSRNTVYDWPVYHVSNGNGGLVWLNQTSAFSAGSAWNSTTPSSTVFSIGANANTNTSATTYVAYCFAAIAGYSAFGSYTGNGSTDGPFVYCGFRPRFVLIKRTDGVGNWFIFDTSRDTYNIEGNYLYTNLSDAEANYPTLDIVSNGFKIRIATYQPNTSGSAFIYAAFAENPFQNALAR